MSVDTEPTDFGRWGSMIARMILVSLALVLSTISVSKAQEDNAPSPAWAVNCSSQAKSPDLACTASQTILIAETGQRVAAAIVSRADGQLTMTLALPHGLNISYGVKVASDDGEVRQLGIVTADQNGAYAEFPITDDVARKMMSAAFLTLTVKAYRGEEVTLKFPLNGFTEALAKI